MLDPWVDSGTPGGQYDTPSGPRNEGDNHPIMSNPGEIIGYDANGYPIRGSKPGSSNSYSGPGPGGGGTPSFGGGSGTAAGSTAGNVGATTSASAGAGAGASTGYGAAGAAGTAASTLPWYAPYIYGGQLALAAYQTYRNNQPPKFKDPGLTPEQKRLSDLYFQSLTNPSMANNASHVTDVSNSILNGYMQSNGGNGLQWTPPQTFSGQNGGAPVRQAWPGAPGGMSISGAPSASGAPSPSTMSSMSSGTTANNSSNNTDPHAVLTNERDPQVQQLAMWIVINNPTLPPDRAVQQARAIVHSSSPSTTAPAATAAPSMNAG